MKSLNVYRLLLALGLCVAPSPLYAHGIKYSLSSGGIGVHAFFDNDKPAVGLFVYVFAPGSSEKFQTGKTDLNGRFIFSPDRDGDWEVLIFDQMGHRLEVAVHVDEAMSLKTDPAAERSTRSLAKYEKALIGIGIIFGVSGLFFWRLGMRVRKKSV